MTMNEYNYTITLHPYGDSPDAGIVQIDPAALYGYFERRDGSEGGGLWFEPIDGALNLIDFDGMAALPLKVVNALRSHGVIVEDAFEL